MSSDALAAYVRAVDDLYATGGGPGTERGPAALRPDAEQRADRVIAASIAATQEVSARLDSDDAQERELVELQLLAGAALDLLTAGDLAGGAEDGDHPTERATAEAPRDELVEILSTPPGTGMGGLIDEEPERGGVADPAKARAELLSAVDDALEDIVDDAGKGGMALVSGVIALPAPPLQDAANAVLREVLDVLGQSVSALLSKAVALIRTGLEKLMRALGKEAREAAREEAALSIDKVKSGNALDALLSRLYEPERIRADVEAQLPADADAERLAAVRSEVAQLAARFRKHRKVMQWLARGLSLLRNWLLGLTPGGPIALVAFHAAGLGYIVYLGGDYVDWHRTDRVQALNVVPGIREVVAQRLGA